jgi:hypothetical protein
MAATDLSYDELQIRVEYQLDTRFSREFVTTKIADAVALIIDECPRVPARLLSGALSENNYKRVVSDVVLRVLRNPGGVTSESEGGYTYATSALVASGSLWLTDGDRRTLNGVTAPYVPGSVGIGLDSGWGA